MSTASRDARRRRVRGPSGTTGAVGLLAASLLVGCAPVQGVLDEVPQMPGPRVTDLVPSEAPMTAPTGTGILSPDGFDAVQRMAVRIRNVGCGTLTTGSGFAIDATVLITNRHVVEQSDEVQVSTYDGRDIDVATASTAALADLAIVRTVEDLPSYPVLADADPVRGDAVTVVGYPQGGALTVTSGTVIGETTDPINENLGQVLVTDAPVEPGSSGSAALDEEGRVIGVVYAKNAAGQSFLVPVSTLRRLLDDTVAFTPTQACEP
ncbi:peptidase S1 [Actinotalea ferrariae CF5-4]|uniref:Peptidase S1 n=1 Tax=Actinotalea ferrariae CF5-4 TaxID=948458 RepID=A0A021W0F0_9CELL|nr:serine protease [Actinotalea ferrariae]EYR64812.1 peptidase S1 [Actinotalea ferrariae CF5-4]